jgi:predicted TIM-barrel fold metal-dependent hydrolase
MDFNEMTLISVDDHIIEPPEMFEAHLPAKYKDVAPRVLRDDDGCDYWILDEVRLPYIGLNAVAGKPQEEYGLEPDSFDDMRPGCFEVEARIGDMNANGVLASLNFPSFPSFCGQRFSKVRDKDLALAMVRAYNDWHIDEWAAAAPGRFIPCSLPPLWDPHLMAAEVIRVAAKGARAVTFSENPAALGLPSLHTDHWDPFWKACSDTGTVVCLHIGSSSQMVMTSEDAPVDVTIALVPLNTLITTSDLLYAPFLRRFPDLKIALSEGGIGWVPWILERIDYVYEHHHIWTKQDFGNRMPSDLFREHISVCFITDKIGIKLRNEIGVDLITWESDYPHSDSVWPNAPEVLAKELDGVSRSDIDKITHLNAMRTYDFNPFSHIPKEQATVGALRAQAQADGIDTSVRSRRTRYVDDDAKARTASVLAPALK